MRILAGTPEGNKITLIWHCEACRKIEFVNWIDTDSAEFGQWCRCGEIHTYKAKKIVLANEQTVVYINPVEDSDSNHTKEVEHVHSYRPPANGDNPQTQRPFSPVETGVA